MSNYNTLKTADTINTVSIVDGAITTSKLGASVTTLIVAGGGPKVTAITYPGNDLAADPAGGQTITLTGTGFVSGCSVFVGAVQASVVTVVSATSVTFTAPALAAATYTLYLVNPDGGTATIVPGISYSGTPIWSTTAGTLGSVYEYAAISNTVAATGDGSISYSVLSGTLPTGSSLNTSTGVISGTSPASAGATTYTFVIRATDAQLQDSDRSFSITVNTDTVTWTTPADNSTTTLGKDAASSTTLLATSAAGNAITYTANTLPTGLSISGATVTGTPTVIASTTSTFTATAATTGRTATRTINWTVSVASDTYFPYTTLLLSGATATETFIADASTNNFAVTIAGDTKPNNFNPYTPGYYSNYFNGTTDYLSVASNAAFNFGTGDFTLEAWVYRTAAFTDTFILSASGTGGMFFGFTGSTTIGYGRAGVAWDYQGASHGMSLNTWYHVTLTRSGTSIRIFVNGVQVGVTQTSSQAYDLGVTSATIGGQGGSYFWAGYISNARIVKGTAVYTGNFPVLTAPLTAITNTSLLTCQSNRFLDNSTNAFAITKSGDTRVNSFTPFVPNTQYAAYGSTYFNGTTDSLSVPSSTAFAFPSGVNFTAEGWVYLTSYSPGSILGAALIGTTNGGINGWFINLGQDINSLRITSNASGSWADNITVTAGNGVPLNTWTHIAFVRNGGSLVLYKNGVSVASMSGASAYNFTSPINSAYIGYISDNIYTRYVTGYISNVRVVKGTAVYTAAFTVPTAPLSATQSANTNGNPSAAITGSATSLLTCQTNQPANNSMFLDNSTNAFAVTRAGNTSAGTFTPYGANWSNYFDGAADGLVMPAGLSTAMGAGFAGNIISFEMWIFPTTFTNGGDGNGIMGAYAAVAANGRWVVIMERSVTTTAKFSFTYTTGTGSSVTVESTASAITLNQWNHIAITVDATTAASSTIKLFANGVLLNTFTGQNMSTQTAYYRPVYIGDVQSQYVSAMVGYISNFRILKGAFAYTGNYTVPTAPLTAIANTVLLTCQSNSLVDNSANVFTISKYGDTSVQRFSPLSPQTQTAITHSAYFDGNGDSLTAPNNAAFAFGTGNFTIEFWINTSNIAQTGYVLQTDTAANTLYVSLSGSTIRLTNVSIAFAVTPTLLSNTWYHIAVVRTGTSSVIYTNGIAGTPVTCSIDFTQAGPSIGNNNYLGYISNLRIVKGVAVYTGTFTPPTAPLSATQSSGTNISAITGTQTSLLTCQSPTFVDNSTNAFAITAYGNSHPRIQNPFGFTNTAAAYSAATYGGSAYFDGTGDYLTVPANLAFSFAGDFTIEFWIYLLTSSSTSASYFLMNLSGPTYFAVNMQAGSFIQAYLNTSSAALNATDVLPKQNAWNHVALVRSGSTVKIYVNGTASATTATNSSTLGSSSVDFNIANGSCPANYMSDFRINRGTAVYKANFVPPTAPLTAITNTSLLLNMTTSGIYDAASMSNLETVGDAKRVATQTPYAGSYYSNYFDGTGDYLTVPSNAALAPSTGDFTCEAWISISVLPSSGGVAAICQNDAILQVANNTKFWFGVYNNSGTLQLSLSRHDTANRAFVNWTPTVGVWYHVAAVRQSGTVKLFIDGVLQTVTGSTDLSGVSFSQGGFTVGAISTPVYMNGYISNFRYVVGTAVYTSSFTPSTTPLTAIANTVLLTCQSNRLLDNSANAGTITKSGNVAVQSFNPFQRNSAATLYFDGTGDYLVAPYNPAYNFGTGNFTIEFWVNTTSTAAYATALRLGNTWTTGSWSLYLNDVNGSGVPSWWSFTLNTTLSTSGVTINDGAWHHIALVRNSTTMTMYIDGTSRGTLAVSTSSVGDTTTQLWIARDASNVRELAGYINDLRITKGVARYTSTFTPPTSAFLTT